MTDHRREALVHRALLTAADLIKFKIIDEIIPEPLGGIHKDPERAADDLKKALLGHFEKLTKEPVDRLIKARYEKFRRIGVLEEK